MLGGTFVVVSSNGCTELRSLLTTLKNSGIDTTGITQVLEEGKIEVIRAIVDQVRQISEEAAKMFIVPGDLLTTQAQNALLKLAEEPPKGCTIVITVTDYRTLLPTIISRARVIRDYCPTTTSRGAYKELATKVYENIGKASAVNLFNILNNVDSVELALFLEDLSYEWELRCKDLKELKIMSVYTASVRKSTNLDRHIKTLLQDLREARVNSNG